MLSSVHEWFIVWDVSAAAPRGCSPPLHILAAPMGNALFLWQFFFPYCLLQRSGREIITILIENWNSGASFPLKISFEAYFSVIPEGLEGTF